MLVNNGVLMEIFTNNLGDECDPKDFDDLFMGFLLESSDSSKQYKCPMCSAVVKGRRGLNLHLRKQHFIDHSVKSGKYGSKTIWSRSRFSRDNELKIQKVLVNTIYGPSKVSDAINGYIDGRYTMKTLPINISYYIKLLGVKPRSSKKDNSPKPEKRREITQNPIEHKVPHKTVTQLLGVISEIKDGEEDLDQAIFGVYFSETRSYEYVSDLRVDLESKVLRVFVSPNKADMLPVSKAKIFLEKMCSGENDQEKINNFDLKCSGKFVDGIMLTNNKSKQFLLLRV